MLVTHPTRARATGPLLAVTGVVMTVIAAVTGRLRTLEPRLLGRENPDVLTSVLHAVVGTLFWTALVWTLAELIRATLCSPHRDVVDPTHTRGRRAWLAAQMWALLALLMIPLESADSAGLTFEQTIVDLPTYITSTPSVTAWLVVAVLGLVVALLALLATHLGGLVMATLVTVLAALPIPVTGAISVGLNHDFATDSGALAAIGMTIAAACVLVEVLDGPDSAVTCRLSWLERVGAIITLAGGIVVTWQGQARHSWLSDRWGVARVVLLIASTVWVILSWLPQSRVRGWLRLGMVTIVLTVLGASSQLVPPRYLIGQTPAVNYLGYELPPAPSTGVLLAPGRPNIGFWTLSILGIAGYLFAVSIIKRRGEKWSGARIGSWIGAWVVVIYLASVGLWEYSSMQFSWHMLVHMTFNMLIPALLVLGAPVTLMREVFRTGDGIDDGLNGPHDCLVAALEWRPTKILFGPFAAWIVFIASFYVVYFTPIFGYLMRYHWGHQWMLLHFLMAGFMLFEYVIGLDDLPASLPHIGRLGFVITAMPFHSFFAVITMNAHQIIGKDFYQALSIPWVTNLRDDQNLGGQITWATGEIPMALVLIALCVQWFVSDRRDQRRVDASEDASLDESLAAYNDMLARMAGQEIKPQDPENRS
ncbi:cytochrome c oxidase assembly protein [Cutibacterium avidum]|uniref:cytochrome c oxidase assembly protein n=1 Tax=Cutibacterium avidum TaxID=33010 RepID=UPI0022646D95|nr:cytochrome c oxidase assembly protein [Cutibacterium avidum]MCX8466931.1 cytochrome c oxidase assembly protein [Cutibacterium avidum]MCX8469847.1 cytochrome c oxidase assembly protein [Cutibacterium avidum]MDU5024256.1 cytochrome c oxidase assembly protein [Cutibacterium avidum]MDU5656085.1 cytochrome c oxidase assembly protein [Cutibacterium avidum]MDU5831128.1 cytochrome c oxidase assembly protein [Cutibacterium avidum]